MMDTQTHPVMVSVCIVTYNHEKFIESCLEGVVRQKLDIAWEICIGEDDSSDGTRTICEKYATMYPHLIRLFKRSRTDVVYKNGKPTGIFNFIETLSSCQGKYIALVEGDDGWVNSEKLQQQFAWMEDHPTASACFHDCKVVSGDEQLPVPVPNGCVTETEPLSLEKILSSGSSVPTASILFRRSHLFPLPGWYILNPSDWKIEVILALKGDIVKFKNAEWSVYRQHAGGLWSGASLRARLNYRKSHAFDLLAAPELKAYKPQIQSYLANTYHVTYEQALGLRDWKAGCYLLGWSYWTVDPISIRLKHVVKSIFKLFYNRK